MKIGFHSFLHQVNAITHCPWHKNTALIQYKEYPYLIEKRPSAGHKHALYTEYDVSVNSFADVEMIENPLSDGFKQMCIISTSKRYEKNHKSRDSVKGLQYIMLKGACKCYTRRKIASSFDELIHLYTAWACSYYEAMCLFDSSISKEDMNARIDFFKRDILHIYHNLDPDRIAYKLFVCKAREQQWSFSEKAQDSPQYRFFYLSPTVERLVHLDVLYAVLPKDMLYKNQTIVMDYLRGFILEDLYFQFYRDYLKQAKLDPLADKMELIHRIKETPLYLLTEEKDGIFVYKSTC